MFKCLKWDLIDHFRRYYLLYIGMIATMLLAIIPIKGNNLWSSVMITLSGGLGFALFVSGLVLAINICYRWLMRDSYLLELSNPIPAWKILLSKILLAGAVNLLSFVFILQLSTFWGRYSTGKLMFISSSNLKGIPTLVLFFLLIDCTILFSFILAKSFRVFNRLSPLMTGIFSSLLILVIISLCTLIMSVNGLLILPNISSKDIITFSGTFNLVSMIFPVFFAGIIIVLEFAVSCILLSKRFQRD